MDYNGPIVNVTNGEQPQVALKVSVEWNNTGIILGSIAGVQFLAMLLVVMTANRAIVLDDSHLAISKLLAATLIKGGPQGSALTGEEIADEMFGESYKTFYGCRQLPSEHGEPIFRADMIEPGEGMRPQWRRPFRDGIYD